MPAISEELEKVHMYLGPWDLSLDPIKRAVLTEVYKIHSQTLFQKCSITMKRNSQGMAKEP